MRRPNRGSVTNVSSRTSLLTLKDYDPTERQVGGLADGYYHVWFYNHDDPRVMKHEDGAWEHFASESLPHDEIDFIERPPQKLSA